MTFCLFPKLVLKNLLVIILNQLSWIMQTNAVLNIFILYQYYLSDIFFVLQGRDDLRQDTVMQQVFGMVNSLLLKNAETRKRRLHVRQYKVRLSIDNGLALLLGRFGKFDMLQIKNS